MAGFLQNNPWNVSPFGASSAFGTGSTPGTYAQAYGQPSGFGQASPLAPQQIHQLQQLLQIVAQQIQQIQQLQQAMQFLPQTVAQLVVQTLIQAQVSVPAFGQQAFGVPFQSLPTNTPFQAGQPGYVM